MIANLRVPSTKVCADRLHVACPRRKPVPKQEGFDRKNCRTHHTTLSYHARPQCALLRRSGERGRLRRRTLEAHDAAAVASG